MKKYLYYGNLGTNERQFQINEFLGLALYPKHDREIYHNALDILPFEDQSIEKIQSQDVFEHLPKNSISKIFDEIYRVLAVGGIFRLSVPDYRCPLLKNRSVYNANGDIIGDLMMGATVSYDWENAQSSRWNPKNPIKISFSQDGNSHLWFPKYELILDLIIQSKIRFCEKIVFYQYFIDDNNFVCNDIPENEMYVIRCSPNDSRSNGKPISIVVDFFK